MMNGHAETSETAAYGQRLPIRIIEERAKSDPESEWLSIPRTTEPADGWEKITYGQAAKAINRVAHKIIDLVGEATPNEFPTIAYIGPNDSRYLAFMFGAVKAGYKALFISPRNPLEGQLRLFQATNCTAVCSSVEFESIVQSWVQQRPMKSFVLAPERELLADTSDVAHIPYDKNWPEAQWHPFVVLHTSGSSGFPKPIVLKNGNIAMADGMRNVPRHFGVLPWVPEMASRHTRVLTPMPLFHIAGLYVAVLFSTFYQSLSLGIGSRPITADLMYQCLQHSGADAVFMPPSIVDDMALVPEHVDLLKGLKYVAWGGGSLTPQGGDILVKNNVTLCNLTSSTEAGPYPIYFQPQSAYWRYFIFTKDFGGNDFRRLPGDEDIYKHFFVRQAKHPGLQGIFWTFQDKDEFDTQDIYKPHPTLPDHWLFYGRADSIIVFSTGEKLNPVSIEAVVLSHPKLKGTLVVGTNRLEPALLLEPVCPPKDDKEAKELIQSVWPLVQEANRDTVTHGHIQHDMILLTNPAKPFPRAGKGTIQRPMAVALYEEEIAELYENVEREQDDVPVLDISSEASLRQSIAALFTTELDVLIPDPNTDFFSAGMDSLHVIKICRLLSAGLKAAGTDLSVPVPPRTIYSNPTLTRLADYLFKLAESPESHGNGLVEDDTVEIKRLKEEYTKDAPLQNANKPPPREIGQTVLLTGSTGTLGSYLLALLVSNKSIAKVICLNRADDGGRQRQIQACAERGLSTDFTKCEFLRADLSLPDLGLGEAYGTGLADVDRVIHNAWPVNFNIPLSSFEPSIRGVRNLVNLSAKAARQVPIIFISSISTVDGWAEGHVPETTVHDLSLAAMGYGQSKQVSSLVLDEAARVSGVPTASIRVGQIAGPRGQSGAWNKQEWLPSIIASSLHLGALPSDLGRLSTVDWVPIEDVANLVVEISLQDVDSINGYFHCANPAVVKWEELAPAVQEFYGPRIANLVSFKEWVDMLQKSSTTTKDVTRNPGIKLIDIYEAQAKEANRGQVLLAMDRTQKHSATARKLEAITSGLVKNWCRQWDF